MIFTKLKWNDLDRSIYSDYFYCHMTPITIPMVQPKIGLKKQITLNSLKGFMNII
tara:strand:+ start:1768 stop:1932 length:165 start_codon:yes stop_codon:yes gene_type:complete